MARKLELTENKMKDELTLTFSVRKVDSEKHPATYIVSCPEMMYSAPTRNPQEVMIGLVNEWIDLDMGLETPIVD
jgi:hypothetical protein